MRGITKRASLLLGVGLALFAISAAPAAADPAWESRTLWADTHLKPGDTAMFKVDVVNLGDEAPSGPTTVTVELPPGVTRIAPKPQDGVSKLNELYKTDWTCAGSASVTCTHLAPIDPRGLYSKTGNMETGFASWILFRVQIAPGASGTHPVTTTVSGGGVEAVEERRITIDPIPAGFGLVSGSFISEAYDAEIPSKTPERQAGEHPFELRVGLDFNQRKGEEPSTAPALRSPMTWLEPEEFVKTIRTNLPYGLVGSPEALPKCPPELFLTSGSSDVSTGCPPETQVGFVDVNIKDGRTEGGAQSVVPGGFSRIPVYNLEPPRGTPADFGFQIASLVQIHIYPNVDPADNYAIRAEVPFITTLTPARETRLTMWGVPGDPAHDHLRMKQFPGETPRYGAPFKAAIKPLLAMPMDCDNPDLHMTGRFESWQQPGKWVSERTAGFQMEGCEDERIRFKPEISMRPTSLAAGGPTGLDVTLDIPQRNETVQNAEHLYEQNGELAAIPTPPVKRVQVVLPEGMTVSTSAAQGLTSCSPEQIKLGTNEPVTCPSESQYGSLRIETPILPKGEPMVGNVYIAEQYKNPFDDFLALYLVIQDPSRGLLVKLPGHIELDEKTGQITTTFDNLPQVPVSSMQMSLKGGVRAALVNPTTCGTKEIKATFTPWHDKSQKIVRTNSYEITHKGNGEPCVKHLAERPFAPKMLAGTLSNSAGAYSPFVFRLTRTDDDQEISTLATKLPKGLLAKVAGISQCPEAAIAVSGHKSGKEELAAPSCPASSYLGSADVGSGVGQILTFVGAKAYLAGPYKGAPLSMVVIAPVVAGPYDLGNVSVRTALDVDRTTAQVEVATDPFPQVFKGIPVRVRDIRIKIDRPESTLNPTSCDPMPVEARISGTGADLFSTHDDVFVGLSERFRASDCAALGFKPKITLKLKGGTKRGQFPALVAKLKARAGDANIKRAQVTLPRTAFLEQGHIRNICSRVKFAAKACPPSSVIGWARATSPLIDGALAGPVVMRSSDNKLPDLVASLNGIIEVNVASRIDSFKSRIRSTFDLLPDVPVDSFELRMQGGKKGLIVNSDDLCRTNARAMVRLTGHNGTKHNFNPRAVPAGCKKAGKGKANKKKQTKNKGGKSR